MTDTLHDPIEGWRATTPDDLALDLAGQLCATPGRVRVFIDGPAWCAPQELAESLLDPIRALGRPAVSISTELFWRDAALRLEHGRHDPLSLPDWLDEPGLRREVLDPFILDGGYLPSLRDPVSDRSTRAPRVIAPPGTVLLITGALLLGRDLPVEHVIHLLSTAADRERAAAADQRWMLPAFDDYDARVRPAGQADVLVKARRTLSVRGLRTVGPR